MKKIDWSIVTKEDVIRAIELFLAENPEYPEPRSTFLLFNGKRLPAKHIRGMAYRVATNMEISKSEYSGGMETVNFFKKRGFEVLYKGQVEKDVEDKCVADEVVHEPPTVEQAKGPTVVSVLPKVENIGKISIPSKNVIEQKNALQLLLNKMFDGDIVCEKTFPWMKTPSEISDVYCSLYEALRTYRGNDTFAKKGVVLRCDFVCESHKLIIEYDERQHFSEARRISLGSYKNIPTHYDRARWEQACTSIQAKDNQPINRDEVRAYYDSTRDIEAYKHGYTLIRIMHGQIDFEKPDAEKALSEMLEKAGVFETPTQETGGAVNLKIAMYLQADQWKNASNFGKILPLLKSAEYDILVFPEFGWVPFIDLLRNVDLANKDDMDAVIDECLMFSEELGKAVVVSSIDSYNTIYSIFANASANEDETATSVYIKHTMTNYSAFEFSNYEELSHGMFSPILYKGYKIGLTICYDCTTALFSRMYGVQGVDLILNGTGGNVVYDKWHKYNQCRAVENHCFNLVTMGGDGKKEKVNSYVYGFNRNGKDIIPELLNGNSKDANVPGGLYLFDLSKDDGGEAPERGIYQYPTENKNKDFAIPAGDVDSLLKKAEKITDNLFVYKHKWTNIIFVCVEDDDIFGAENILPLLYHEKLKKIQNKRYVIVCKYKNLTESFYRNKLSVVLKVRAMENFCAVILESDLANRCYQTGKSKTAQVVKNTDGAYWLELSRMTGPEAIWKNKGGDFKASWRSGFEALIQECVHLSKTVK